MADGGHERAIRAILKAANHFDMLKLPRPTADLMEQPIWDVTDDVIGRAFRKLSLSCHPDKSSHRDAPRAFEQLKKAKACLLNPLTREDYLIEFVRQQKTSWEGNWGAAESAFGEKERVSTMRKTATQQQGEDVADAMRERREKAEKLAAKQQRVHKAQAARSRERAPSPTLGGLLGDSDESDGDGGGGAPISGPSCAPAPASGRGAGSGARKRPKFM